MHNMGVKTIFFMLLYGIIVISADDELLGYATCGEENSDNVESVINATVARLMQLRQPSWGWVNTPQVVLGIQLSAQEQFFGINKTIEQMKTEIDNDLGSMNLGKLALYVMAVRSACQDPRSFGGRNLVAILDRRSRNQFFYNGTRNIIPFDRYYRYGLAMGALCINNSPPKNWAVRRILKGINNDGSVSSVHSVDDAAQLLLAFKCMESETRPRDLMRKINKAVNKLTTFLKSSINIDGNDFWIGNKYSSPSSALGLMEEYDGEDGWMCNDIMKSLAVEPGARENEGALSQRLPSLSGISYLDLKNVGWECAEPVPIPTDYQPICDPSDPPTCNPPPPEPGTPIAEVIITVRLTVYTDPPNTMDGEPSADVVVMVREGSSLFQTMVQARTEGLITFQSRSTAWGESIVSIQGVASNSDAREYWSLIDGTTNQPLSQGASSYVPTDGSHIVFRLKTW